MIIDVVEAKPFHCGQMTRILREEHRNVLVGLGVGVHKELRVCFDASTYRKACFADGQLAGLWGVAGTQVESTGLVWLAIAGWATRYPVACFKMAATELVEIHRLKRTVHTLIFPADEASFWFAKKLGFKVREDVDTIFEAVLMEHAA